MSAREKLALSVTAICVSIALASFLLLRERANAPGMQTEAVGPSTK